MEGCERLFWFLSHMQSLSSNNQSSENPDNRSSVRLQHSQLYITLLHSIICLFASIAVCFFQQIFCGYKAHLFFSYSGWNYHLLVDGCEPVKCTAF